MSLYLAIPLTASVLLFAFASTILAMSPNQVVSRRAALLLYGAGAWAFCEVLWNVAPDASTAMRIHRVALPGLVFVAPLGLSLIEQATEQRVRWLPHLIRIGSALGAVFLVIGWTTDWMVADMVRTEWGFGLVPGPAFTFWLLSTAVLVLVGLLGLTHANRHAGTEIQRLFGPLVVTVTTATFVPGVISDGVLPALGHQPPRIATICFALFGALLVLAIHRYGYASLPNRAFSRRIIRTLPDGIALCSLVGRIRSANPSLEALLGVGPDGATGLAVRDILDVPLFDPPREVRQLECELRPAAGARIPIQLSATVIVDNTSAPMGVVLIVSDQREVVSLRDRVITSDRLAAVGQLAAGIAHEINNPLAFVRTNLNLLRQQWGEVSVELAKREALADLCEATGEWDELIEESLEGVDRAVTIVRDVREFSHVGTGEFESSDLNALLDQVLRIVSGQLGTRIKLTRRFAKLPLLGCRPQRLKQLFLNLLVNAAQSISGDGSIEVRTERRGARVEVTVADDGCGIPDALRDRIFDPFFTTKDVGVGTGLGLAISQQIALAHGGGIRVESRPGGGSVFTVSLPIGPAAERQSEARPASGTA
jgi:PAS domain S-box-containing protein